MFFIAGLLLSACCYVPSQKEVPHITPVKESVAKLPPINMAPKDIKFTEFTHNNHKWYLVRIYHNVQTVIHSPDCPCNNK